MALLEFVLVLGVRRENRSCANHLVRIGVRLSTELLQLEVVVVIVHLRFLASFNGILPMIGKIQRDEKRLHFLKLLVEKGQDLIVDASGLQMR